MPLLVDRDLHLPYIDALINASSREAPSADLAIVLPLPPRCPPTTGALQSVFIPRSLQAFLLQLPRMRWHSFNRPVCTADPFLSLTLCVRRPSVRRAVLPMTNLPVTIDCCCPDCTDPEIVVLPSATATSNAPRLPVTHLWPSSRSSPSPLRDRHPFSCAGSRVPASSGSGARPPPYSEAPPSHPFFCSTSTTGSCMRLSCETSPDNDTACRRLALCRIWRPPPHIFMHISQLRCRMSAFSLVVSAGAIAIRTPLPVLLSCRGNGKHRRLRFFRLPTTAHIGDSKSVQSTLNVA